jgi:hypothetical protein
MGLLSNTTNRDITGMWEKIRSNYPHPSRYSNEVRSTEYGVKGEGEEERGWEGVGKGREHTTYNTVLGTPT